MKIDIEKIRRNNNLTVLESYLQNLTFSNVSENEIASVPKKYIVKLIKIYQFIIECLLNCQNTLENHLQILKNEKYKLINENENKDSIIKKNRSLISNLKQEKQNDTRLLLTYKNIIYNVKKNNQNLPINIIIKEDKNKEQLENENLKYETIYCQYCKNVKFNSKIDLQNHLRKAHRIKENEAKKKFEKKLYELTNQFEDYVKTQGSTFNNFMETQSKIENENYEKEIGKIENKFKNTLNDLKDLYITNYLKNEKPNKNKLDEKIVIEKKNDDENINFLKNQLSKMNLTLEKINKDNQKAINDLRKSFNEKFKKIIFEKENNTFIDNHNKSISFDFNDENFLEGDILNENNYDNQVMITKNNNNKKFKNKLENKNILNEKVEIKKTSKKVNGEIWNNEIIEKKNLNIIDDLENKKEIHLQPKKIALKSIEEEKEEKKEIKKEEKHEEKKEEKHEEKKEEKHEEKKEEKKEENKGEIKEDNKDEDIKENQQENNILKQKIKKINKYNSLNEFYISYKERDQNTFKEPIEENYIEKILPDNFEKDDNYIQNIIKESFLNITNKNNKNNDNINFENFGFENIEKKNIISLIDNTLKNIEKINSKNKILKQYYESIYKYLNLNSFEKVKKKIVDNENPHRRDFGILNEKHDDIISDINRINLSQIENINDEFEIDLSKKEESKEDEFENEEEESEKEKEEENEKEEEKENEKKEEEKKEKEKEKIL